MPLLCKLERGRGLELELALKGVRQMRLLRPPKLPRRPLASTRPTVPAIAG